MVSNKNTSTKKRKCSICNSVENEPRIIGNYIVKLSSINLRGHEQLVCQGCSRKLKTEETYKKKLSFKTKLSFFGFRKNKL